jgi:ERCC4-related helicase
MIKDFTPRLYQQTILGTCVLKNTLVVLPTGLGKTNIFLMLAAQRLKQYPNSKIMLLGPTRPLIDQYFEAFKKNFEIDEAKMAVITGFVSPDKRVDVYKNAKIVFSTPQAIENDVITRRIELKEFSLLGIDEAHRATGDYSYNFIVKQYEKCADYPRIIAMTASPGSDLEKINEVIKNLNIEAVEVRTEDSPDVAQYMQKIEMKWLEVSLPKDFLDAKKFFEECLKTKLKELKDLELIQSYQTNSISRKDLLSLSALLQSKMASGEKSLEIMRGLSLLAECMKIEHALELLESQGIAPLNEYLENIMKDALTSKTKATQNLARDLHFRSAAIKVKNLYDAGIEHPKLKRLEELLKEKVSGGKKAIVFTQFRDTGKLIIRTLEKIDGMHPKLFVGQMKKKESGLSQKKQKEMLDEFRENGFNVLVATSVGEEGLDIPKVDYVIFYEPIPSAIRHIQRRGRTGRLEDGQVFVLMTKGTRDEAYKWSAHHKEKRMYDILSKLQKTFDRPERKEGPLTRYITEKEEVIIYADHREKANGCVKELIDMGVKIKLETLEVGDYLLSSRIAVEFKQVADFVDSIIDGRLLGQLKNLRKYEKPVIIIEGKEDVYSQRNVHPNAIRGMIATITIDYGIPIIRTDNSKETASIMAVIAKREQIDEKQKEFSLHTSKPISDKELQEYIVGSLPGVGGGLAKPLLEKFGNVRKIFTASEESLQKVDLIGEKKAKRIREILDREYEGN